jgi:hypothetical protein
MLGSRQQRPHVLAKDGLAADGDRVERCAMEAVPQRQRLVPAGGEAGELQGHPDRQRPAGCEQDLAERVGCQPGELFREVDCRGVGKASRRERKRVELPPDRGHDVRVTIADLVHVVAVEVHHAAAFDVGEPDAVAGSERVEARRRQRLMQEDVRIGVEQRARPRMHVRRFELAAQRRGVDVAFGSGIDRGPRIIHRRARERRDNGQPFTKAANRSWYW